MNAGPDDSGLRLLLVEDTPADARLLIEVVADAGHEELTITHAATLAEAFSLLDLEVFDVALLDLSLPDGRGLEVVRSVHGRAPALPIVVLSGLEDEALAVQAVHEGAQDYLVKRHLHADLLVRAVRYAIERVRALARLEQAKAEQLRVKDELLSLVSHELRTPLAACYQFVTILLDGLAGDLSEDQRHYLELTLRNLMELRTMIADLLESNRSLAGIDVRPRPVEVSRMIADARVTFSATAAERSIDLAGHVEPKLPQVAADPGRIGQVLGNLLGNALKFTPPGGRIELEARLMPDERFVALSVCDTGPGIPEEERARIFDRLYQIPGQPESSRKGLGLGLYICRELVLAHRGEIWVESGPDGGSVFAFTLPIAHAAKEAEQPAAPLPSTPGSAPG